LSTGLGSTIILFLVHIILISLFLVHIILISLFLVHIIPNPLLRHTYAESFERDFSDWNLPVLGGKACELAYTKGAAWLEVLLAKIAENAKVVTDILRPTRVKVTPLEGTYLLWIDCRPLGLSPRELEKRMIANDVFSDEGYIFGTSGVGFERLNLACPTRYVRAAAERMAAMVHSSTTR
jgi:bifunctional pyridoxal-dependent enzyme with beta-cystathionase and maltose regulon repressor activities